MKRAAVFDVAAKEYGQLDVRALLGAGVLKVRRAPNQTLAPFKTDIIRDSQSGLVLLQG